jgi:hypothetical protein
MSGEENVLKAISNLIIVTSEYFNTFTPINEVQAIQIASLFIDQYSLETYEDLVLCFKYAKLNRYGNVTRFDGQVIFSWFHQYLNEKYEYI